MKFSKKTAPALGRSWLVQRLNTPYEARPGSLLYNGEAATPFSFGGGLLNGGLSKDAMALFKGVFVFDYMGAAEFEFGAVPEAFQKLTGFATDGLLTAWTFDLSMENVRSFRSRGVSTQTAPIYVLAPAAWKSEVEERITEWASGINDLKEQTRLASTLLGEPYSDTEGWLELNNGFMFFTSREMWEKVCTLFGVETP